MIFIVTQWFLKMIREQVLDTLDGYDRGTHFYWVKEMEDAGFTLEKVRQGIYSLSEPMKHLRS